MNAPLFALSFAGILISVYALVLKKKKEKDKGYRAICDINEKVSCTKAMESEYGSLFLLPNSLYGILFYALIAVLSWADSIEAIFVLSSLAVIGSAYLAYLSFYKLRIICPLCTAIYGINLALLILSARHVWG